MSTAFAYAKASFLCGIGADFVKQNRTRLASESHKTPSLKIYFQTYTPFNNFDFRRGADKIFLNVCNANISLQRSCNFIVPKALTPLFRAF